MNAPLDQVMIAPKEVQYILSYAVLAMSSYVRKKEGKFILSITFIDKYDCLQ